MTAGVMKSVHPTPREASPRDTVLLVHPSGTRGRSALAHGFLIPPLGLMSLVAQLRRHGHSVRLINEEIDGPAPLRLLAPTSSEAPLFVGIYASQASEDRVRAMIRACRDRSTALRIVVGGPATQAPESFLEAGADAAGLGEGDETILDLVAWAHGDRSLGDVPGVVFARNGTVERTATRPLVRDLDTLPFPNWDDYPPDRTRYDNLYPSVRQPFATLITSRGCPMRCVYCASPEIWRRAVRRRSVGSVLEEIDGLRARFGVRFLDIYDDVFNLAPRWTVEFCEALLRRGNPPLRWGAYFYPANFDAGLLRLARRAGLSVLKIGVQSGSPEILRNIQRRPETAEQATLFLDEAARLGIFSSADFIFGLPGETARTLADSVRYIRGIRADAIKIGKLVRLPGSPLDRQESPVPAAVTDAEIDRAVREALFKYYLRPAGIAHGLRWVAHRQAAGLHGIIGLARVAFAGRSFRPARQARSVDR